MRSGIHGGGEPEPVPPFENSPSGAGTPSAVSSVAGATAARLSRLVRPRSVAVVGGREAARVVEQCVRMGFAGALWPVHPKRSMVAGRPAFRSVAALPAPPDAAFVGVNRHATVEVVAVLGVAIPPGAVARSEDEAVAAILGIACFEVEHRDRLEELDVKPLGIRARGRGAVVLDVPIRTRETAS